MTTLKTSYEEKLFEKDEKLRQMKTKYDDLMGKYQELVQENTNLQNKIASMPSDLKKEM